MKVHILRRSPLDKFFAVIGIVILVISAVLTSACSLKPEASIVIAGSTSVQPFAEILAEEYMRQNPGITIDVQGGGSSAGIMAVSSGTADIGMSSRNLKEDEKKNSWSVEIAKDGLAVIVNPGNPVVNLTLDQLRNIYAGTITNWSLVGGTNSKIHVVVREEGSGTRDAFIGMVMGKTEINNKAIVQESNGTVRLLISSDRNAIGFISLGLVDKTVTALALEGIAATRGNVVNGSYKLSRPFLFLTSSEPEGQTRQFIDFILSEAGQGILDKEGLISSLAESSGK